MTLFLELTEYRPGSLGRNETLRSSSFRDVTQRRYALRYRSFGTTYRYHLEGSSSPRRSESI